MIKKIIDWTSKNRFLVACATLMLVARGVHTVHLTPVDDELPQVPTQTQVDLGQKQSVAQPNIESRNARLRERKPTLGMTYLSIFANWQNKSS
jgi:Cu/Ag efflux pump CusA